MGVHFHVLVCLFDCFHLDYREVAGNATQGLKLIALPEVPYSVLAFAVGSRGGVYLFLF